MNREKLNKELENRNKNQKIINMHADKMQESKWNFLLSKSYWEGSQILGFPLFSDKQEITASTSLMVKDSDN